MWICRQFLLEEEAGATESSDVVKGLAFLCSHLCSLESSGSGGVKKQRFAVSKHTSGSLPAEPFRRSYEGGDMHMETIQL